MHEFTIASEIIEIVKNESKKANALQIKKVEIDVGELSGVVIEALQFALDSIIQDSEFEKMKIIIHSIKGQAQCNHCGKCFHTNELFSPCPQCQSFDLKITGGQDLKINRISIE